MTGRTIRRTLSYLLILASLTLLAAACTRVLPPYVASLTPAAGSSATGQATARLTTGNTLTVSGSYQGLGSPVASVQVAGAGPGLPFGLRADGGTSGGFGGTLTLSADEVTALNNGQLRIVIYTTNYPVTGGTPELSGSLAPSG